MAMDYFYSEEDKVLFAIPKDYQEDNASSVTEFTTLLIKRCDELAKLAGHSPEGVYFQIIEESTRFRRMAVYSIRDFDTDKVPHGVMRLSGTWTMHKWIAF